MKTITRDLRVRGDSLALYFAKARQHNQSNWITCVVVFLLRTQGIPACDLAAVGFTAQQLWTGGYDEQQIRRTHFASTTDAALDTRFRQWTRVNMDTEELLEELGILPQEEAQPKAA